MDGCLVGQGKYFKDLFLQLDQSARLKGNYVVRMKYVFRHLVDRKKGEDGFGETAAQKGVVRVFHDSCN